MNVKMFFKALSVKAGQCFTVGKKMTKSYVSLFLVMLLGATTSLAWFAEHQAASINSSNLKFQSSSSLRVNNEDFGSNDIKIPAFTLDEASSVDGRNIFFPVGESFNTTTSQMHFREGNSGDRITGEPLDKDLTDPDYIDNPEKQGHYVYKNIKLQGTSAVTPVYIKSYKVTVEDGDGDTDATNDSVNGVYQDELVIVNSDGTPLSQLADDAANHTPDHQVLPPDKCAIRLAFIDDSANEPKVIDPSAQVADYVDNSNAVAAIDADGKPTKLQTTNADSFSSFYYREENPNPLFEIPGGETLNVTLAIWLEGTLPDSDKYIGKKISVEINIESNFTGMESIYFIDETAPDDAGGSSHWVNDNNTMLACSYKDPFSSGSYKTVIMTKMPDYDTYHKWTAAIPRKAVTSIAFYRLCPSTSHDPQGTIWNSWHTNEKVRSWVNNGISSGWYQRGSCDLDYTRQKTDGDGNTYNAVTYTATHGNGYGYVPDDDAQKSKKRLSPCIGYWDYTGEIVTPTQAPTESGSVTPSKIRVGVSLDFKNWVSTDLSGNYVMHMKTSLGDYTFTNNRSGDHLEQSFNLAVGEVIQRFYLQSPWNTKNIDMLDSSQQFTIPNSSSGYNVGYTMNNDDKFYKTTG